MSHRLSSTYYVLSKYMLKFDDFARLMFRLPWASLLEYSSRPSKPKTQSIFVLNLYSQLMASQETKAWKLQIILSFDSSPPPSHPVVVKTSWVYQLNNSAPSSLPPWYYSSFLISSPHLYLHYYSVAIAVHCSVIFLCIWIPSLLIIFN